jgi:hypothetical protein
LALFFFRGQTENDSEGETEHGAADSAAGRPLLQNADLKTEINNGL